uniref:Uncharacterized protein n=1 Tax=Panagrolaimus superbus TaxID=310955 RepID=A0A914YS11_9BILA
MSGIESVAGQKGLNFVRQWYESLNAKVLKPLLTKNYKKQLHDSSQILRAYQKITLQDAMNIFQSGQRPMSSMSNISDFNASIPAVCQLFNGLLNQKLHEKEHRSDSSEGDSYLSDNSIGITLTASSGGYRRYF